MIIGLSGYARSGKDEAAKVLVEEFGFKRVAFADKLRDVLYALNPILDMAGQEWAYSEWAVGPYTPGTHIGGITPIHLQSVIDVVGWDGYKETKYGPEIRRLLQRLGTEAGRQTLWDSIWVDAALAGITAEDKIVITDCRFENEAEAVTERGGEVWRIERAGNEPNRLADGSIHPSETSLDDWDFDCFIANDGTLEDFREEVRKAAREGFV